MWIQFGWAIATCCLSSTPSLAQLPACVCACVCECVFSVGTLSDKHRLAIYFSSLLSYISHTAATCEYPFGVPTNPLTPACRAHCAVPTVQTCIIQNATDNKICPINLWPKLINKLNAENHKIFHRRSPTMNMNTNTHASCMCVCVLCLSTVSVTRPLRDSTVCATLSWVAYHGRV